MRRVHHETRADEYIASLTERLKTELGVEVSITWAATGFDDEPSDDDHMTQPVLVLGRVVGAVRVRWPATTPDDIKRQAWVAALAGIAGAGFVIAELSAALKTAELFEAGFESSKVGLQLVGRDGTFLHVNEAFANMVGRTRDELIGTNWRDITDPADLHDGDDAVSSPVDGEPGRYHAVKRYVRPDGTVVWGDMTATVVGGSDPQHVDEHLHLTQVIDVTARVEALAREREMREQLEASERRYRSLVEPAPDGVLRVAVDGTILDVNHRVEVMFGVEDRNAVIGRNIGDSLPPSTATAIAGRIEDVVRTGRPAEVWRHWVEPVDRDPGWYMLRILPETADEPGPVRVVYVVSSDVTELVENEQRLASMALIDPLTGVSNRAAIFDRLQHAIDRLRRHPATGVAVAICDLDHFKAINDTYGHARGDEALRAVARRLQSFVREQDTVGRLGGDEFIVIAEDIADQGVADALGDRLGDAIARASVDVADGQGMSIAGSVGVAWSTTPVDLNEFVARADRAMYNAKRHGRGRSWTEEDASVGRQMSNMTLLRELQAALDRSQFDLHYQPIVESSTGRVVAVEALLRWNHPDGIREPSAFLGPLLETGRIGPVGLWVVRTSLRRLQEWRTQPGLDHLVLHLNASPAELASPQYGMGLRSALEETGLPPDAVCIEVTEQALAGTVVSSSALADIASIGVQLVLDDFGTGVSSLAQLRNRPLHGIKIDRSFISGASSDPTDEHIAAAVVTLARSLSLAVTAEGVETAAQAAWLDELGCPFQQGWFYAAASPAEEIPELVRASAAV